MGQFLLYLGGFFFILLLSIGGYLIYLFLSYDRLPDQMPLVAVNTSAQQEFNSQKSFRCMTFNIGYGAYTSDYTFFMDGGKSARAKDRQTVLENLAGIAGIIEKIQPEIVFFQEVDQLGDRSKNINEVAYLQNNLPSYNSIYAPNYHSAYLFYPFHSPIGRAKSGLLTLTKGTISEAYRYRLPIETTFNKFFDLDRAFSVCKTPLSNQKALVSINAHLSAYTKDPAIQTAQLNKLFAKMTQEYEKGNYVLCGGDFNHDLLGNSPEVFNNLLPRHSWDQPFPENQIPKGFSLVKGNLAKEKIPSTRKLDIPYQPGVSYVSLLDGFLVSDNLKILHLSVYDGGFQYSDHNPVVLDFQLLD